MIQITISETDFLIECTFHLNPYLYNRNTHELSRSQQGFLIRKKSNPKIIVAYTAHQNTLIINNSDYIIPTDIY